MYNYAFNADRNAVTLNLDKLQTAFVMWRGEHMNYQIKVLFTSPFTLRSRPSVDSDAIKILIFRPLISTISGSPALICDAIRTSRQ